MSDFDKKFDAQIDNLLAGKRVDASVFNSWKKRVPGSQGDYAVMARIALRVAGKKNGNGKAKASAE
tara:strand:- start:20384 stop:20581 length:198 start_codon:yes stop_codon:yes gene_type:complete